MISSGVAFSHSCEIFCVNTTLVVFNFWQGYMSSYRLVFNCSLNRDLIIIFDLNTAQNFPLLQSKLIFARAFCFFPRIKRFISDSLFENIVVGTDNIATFATMIPTGLGTIDYLLGWCLDQLFSSDESSWFNCLCSHNSITSFAFTCRSDSCHGMFLTPVQWIWNICCWWLLCWTLKVRVLNTLSLRCEQTHKFFICHCWELVDSHCVVLFPSLVLCVVEGDFLQSRLENRCSICILIWCERHWIFLAPLLEFTVILRVAPSQQGCQC